MPDITAFTESIVQGMELGSLLSLQPHPLWGYGLAAVGLALCLVGYLLYRFVVALAAAVAGGAVIYIAAPGFQLEGTALWSTVIGSVLVLFVLGWFLYGLAVFLIGATTGLASGTFLWLIAAGRLTSLADLATLALTRQDVLAIAATATLPALALGFLAIRWERRAITVLAVLLGALVLALGVRYARLPGPAADWGPVLAGAAMAAGLYLNYRSPGRPWGSLEARTRQGRLARERRHAAPRGYVRR